MTDSSDEHENEYEYDYVQASQLTRNKADGQSPGEMLREARLAHDYSVVDLCAQTKLSPRAINALEDNDFKALSQPVFTRGYYRQCAKVLDIDTDRLMAAYAAWGGESAPQAASPTGVDVVPEDVTPGSWRSMGLIGGLILLLVIIGAVVMLMPGADLPDENSAMDAPAVAQSDTGGESIDSTAPPAGAPAGGGTSSADRATGTADSDADASEQTNPASSSTRRTGGRNVNDTLGRNAAQDDDAAPSEPATPEVDPAHLVLTFTGRSWVDVRDASGARLLTGIYETGETHALDGKPPYKITLGYAPGVEMTIGGQAVDIDASTTGNATARLTVDARDD